MDLIETGVLGAAQLLARGEITRRELVTAYLDRITRVNGGPPSADGRADAINAWVRVYPDRALEAAARADEPGSARSALSGIPIGLKDVFPVRALPITASSDVLADQVAEADCEPWRRLVRHGWVLLGHTHTHEFAAGSTTNQCGNPWRLGRITGGSSGGSAAAVAARMVPAALGTDTGGSLRIPAALCGISTIKPTCGRIPIDGVIPLAHTMDHVGPMARSVADCAVVYDALAGSPDGTTPTSPKLAAKPLSGRTIAVTDRTTGVELESDVGDLFDSAIAAVQRLGARVTSLPSPSGRLTSDGGRRVFADFKTILAVDNWAYHRQWTHRRDRYQADVRALVDAEQAHPPSAEDYALAQARRAELGAAWQGWMFEHGVDAIIEPTTPITAPRRATRGARIPEREALASFTLHWDMTGHPVVGLPAGLGAKRPPRRHQPDRPSRP